MSLNFTILETFKVDLRFHLFNSWESSRANREKSARCCCHNANLVWGHKAIQSTIVVGLNLQVDFLEPQQGVCVQLVNTLLLIKSLRVDLRVTNREVRVQQSRIEESVNSESCVVSTTWGTCKFRIKFILQTSILLIDLLPWGIFTLNHP